MRKWPWIALAILAAGCSQSNRQPALTGAPDAAPLRAERSLTLPTNIEPAAHTIVGPLLADCLIPAGTQFEVRVEEPLNTRRNRSGDYFWATLVRPVVVDGATLVPEGTRVTGRVTAAESRERMNDRELLAIEIESFSVSGKSYRVRTNVIERGLDAPGGGRRSRIVSALHALARNDGSAEASQPAPAPRTPEEQAALPAESRITFTLTEQLKM